MRVSKAWKYFIIGLVADLIIVFLTVVVLSAQYDGICHTIMGGSFSCSLYEYFKTDVVLGLAVMAPIMLPILLIILIVGVVFGYKKTIRIKSH